MMKSLTPFMMELESHYRLNKIIDLGGYGKTGAQC